MVIGVVHGIDSNGIIRPLPIDPTTGAVDVNIRGGAGSGGTAMTDDGAFTPGSTSITPAGGTYRSVRDAVDDNDGGVFAMTQKRAILACLETPNADSAMDDTNDAVRVNIVAGAGSGGTAITDDAAFTVGSTSLTPVGGTYKSSRDAVDDNDAGAFAMTAKRALMICIETPNADSVMDDTNDCIKTSLVVKLPAGDQNIGDVDILSIPAPLNVVGNGAAATALRVTLANDSTGIIALTTSSAVIGKLAANDGVDIGNVDIASIAAGSNRIGKITIRNSADSADIDPLSESAFTSRIGEVTASPVANTILARLKDLLTGIVLATGANAIGKLAANDGVDIGDVTINNASIAVTQGTATNLKAQAECYQGGSAVGAGNPLQVSLANTGANATAVKVDNSAVTQPITHSKTIKHKSASYSSSGDNTLLSAVVGKKITVFAISITTKTDISSGLAALVQDGAAGTELWGWDFLAPSTIGAGANLAMTPPAYLFQGSTNTLLNLNLSAAKACRVSLSYWEE